jgi:hypothetical protein
MAVTKKSLISSKPATKSSKKQSSVETRATASKLVGASGGKLVGAKLTGASGGKLVGAKLTGASGGKLVGASGGKLVGASGGKLVGAKLVGAKSSSLVGAKLGGCSSHPPFCFHQTWAFTRSPATIRKRPARLRRFPKILASPDAPNIGLPAVTGSLMREQ